MSERSVGWGNDARPADKTALGNTRIRGIYATALTRLLLDLGVSIIDPTPVIAERLRPRPGRGPARVRIDDRIDLQGIRLKGELADVHRLAAALVGVIPETVRIDGPLATTVIFCQAAKAFLDRQRRRVLPTLADHHLLKAHNVAGVDQAEEHLGPTLEDARVEGHRLWLTALEAALQPGDPVRVVHAKPWKRDVVAQTTVDRFADGFLTLRRTFRAGGVYDSLREPKLEGDWGMIEVVAGGSILRRRCFRADGRLIGELFNVQTPAEIGPGEVWYVDLEVDVLRTTDGRVSLVDLEEMGQLAASGVIGAEVIDRARQLAEELARILRAGQDWRIAAAEPPAV